MKKTRRSKSENHQHLGRNIRILILLENLKTEKNGINKNKLFSTKKKMNRKKISFSKKQNTKKIKKCGKKIFYKN